MFWHLILVLFSPLYLMFALLFRSDQDRLVVALYQQVLVLQRHVVGRRAELTQIRPEPASALDPPPRRRNVPEGRYGGNVGLIPAVLGGSILDADGGSVFDAD